MNKSKAIRVAPGLTCGVYRMSVPGDKSISQRVALLAGLARGESVVTGYLRGEDCLNTLRAMERLGARVRDTGETLIIEGTGNALVQPNNPLNLGNSGTGTRLLAGLLAGFPLSVTLTGDSSLCSRPMRRIQEPLEQMGATVRLTGEKGTAPIFIQGGALKGITYRMPMPSAQVKSCVLLAGLFAEGRTVLLEPAKSRDHTERLFRTLGVPLEMTDGRLELEGFGTKGPDLRGFTIRIPGDISSAAFCLVAAACTPGLRLTIEGVGLNPGREAILSVLHRMGASVVITPRDGAGEEPMGDLTVEGGTLQGTEIGGPEIPSLIDELPILAVAGALASGETVIRDAGELRFKESDRIAVMVRHLTAMGVQVSETTDGMVIQGGTPIRGGVELDAHGDHRIAMSMAVMALFAEEPVTLRQVECVSTSYPAFWNDLKRLGAQVHETE
ncbi:MAG: 3-phosphoshikimate 1-carboxyvinyltransferase [Kiritimatiellae bacterium]|nr:3-phosphoshikimate 1-carboxyvinyltransferase [Kiritimatiellia bacterium]